MTVSNSISAEHLNDFSAAAGDSQMSSLARFSRIQSPVFGLHQAGSAERARVEDYIHDKFMQAHGASVSHFLPDLITLSCHSEYSAAVGLCAADRGPLFAEHYLTEPLEQAVQSMLGISADRQQIVEIGNLVSTWKGSSLLLFVFLSELIDRLGFHWAIFTATREVGQLLARLHYAPVVIADADPRCLEDGGASWGSYYTHQPRVMIGDVRAAVAQSRSNRLYRTTAALLQSRVEQIALQYQAHYQSANRTENQIIAHSLTA